MKIAISGGTGFVGRHLAGFLAGRKHEVVLIGRGDFAKGIDRLTTLLSGVDAVVNLAGAPVIRRWSDSGKKEILSSRINTTSAIVEAIGSVDLTDRPKVMISASAIGIYNSESYHDEFSQEYGQGFLTEVCQKWENGLEPLMDKNVRTCIIRLGLVLGIDGGSLKKMVPIFKSCLGGKIGNGRQGFSFIHINDLCKAIEFLLANEHSHGIYNMVSPDITTNAGFTKALAKILRRPAIFTVPPFILRLIYGEGAEAILSGQFVYPKRLLDEGFRFEFAEIHQALADLLKKK